MTKAHEICCHLPQETTLGQESVGDGVLFLSLSDNFQTPPPNLVLSGLMGSLPPHLCSRQPTHLAGPPALSLSMALHPPHPAFFQKGPALPFLEQTSLSSLGPSSNITLSAAAPRHLWTPQAFTHVSEPYLEKHCLLPLTWHVSWAPTSPRANLRADARPDPRPLCSGMKSR